MNFEKMQLKEAVNEEMQYFACLNFEEMDKYCNFAVSIRKLRINGPSGMPLMPLSMPSGVNSVRESIRAILSIPKTTGVMPTSLCSLHS